MFFLNFLEKARQEWFDSSAYYEIQKKGLGERFSNILVNHLNLIQKSPELYQKTKKDYREVLIFAIPVLNSL